MHPVDIVQVNDDSHECFPRINCPLLGHDIHLTHLNFDTRVQIADNTILPLRGTAFIGRLGDDGDFHSTNCPLAGAEVCLHLKLGRSSGTGDMVVDCVQTDSAGNWKINAIVGSL